MARTARTFSRRGRAEAKDGENIGQDHARRLIEKARHENQQKQTSTKIIAESRSEQACGSV